MKITKLISAIIIITVAFSRGATFNVTDVSSFQAVLTTAGANGEADIINVAAGIYNMGRIFAQYYWRRSKFNNS